LGAAACVHCGDTASAPDGGADAAVDAPRDASRVDATDASSWDGGEINDWPDWRRLTEADPNCPIDIPKIAVKDAVPAIQWIPCKNANPKCQQVDTTGWSDGTYVFPKAKVSVEGTLLVTLRMIKSVQLPTEAEWVVYAMPSLEPLAAVRLRKSAEALCNGYVSVSGTRMAFLGFGLDSGSRHLAHQVPEDFALRPSFVELQPSLKDLGSTEVLASSDTTVAFDLQPVGSIVHNKPPSTSFGMTKGLDLSIPFVVAGDVYASSEYGFGDGWENYYRVDADGSAAPYRAVPQRHVGAMASDGARMYWAESYGGANPLAPPAVVDIWSAPYTREPATLAATAQKLATLGAGAAKPVDPVASKGYYAFGSIPGTRSVVEASSGKVQTVTVGGGYDCWQLTHVTATELWCVEKKLPGPNGTGLIRLQLDPW
jgi:hypothetical protein